MSGSIEMSGPTERLPATSAYLQVDGLSKRFDQMTAVAPCSFGIQKGEVIGLLGSDGAGKTTLLRMLASMIRPSGGQVRIDGLDPRRDRLAVKARIGYMPQQFGLYQDLTVAENFDFFMNVHHVRGTERQRRRERYLGFSNLLPFLERPAGALSGGMKQKLGLACVLVHQPQLLILDEPTNGVDPVSRREFWEILKQMNADGMTILVSTAYMDEGALCDRLILMHAARILDIKRPAEFVAGRRDMEAAMIELIREADPGLTGMGHDD